MRKENLDFRIKAEDRNQKTEDRKQKTEARKLKTNVIASGAKQSGIINTCSWNPGTYYSQQSAVLRRLTAINWIIEMELQIANWKQKT